MWWRAFNGRSMRTLQWADVSSIHERAGPVRVAFDLHAEGGGLHYESQRVWLFGVPEQGRDVA